MSKPLIRRSHLTITRNLTLSENLYTLVITLYRDSIAYNFSIPRLVYCHFAEAFDLADKSILISTTTGDGRDTHVDKLFVSDRQMLGMHSSESGSSRNHYSNNGIPVTQFSSSGEPLQSFHSINHAAKILGYNLGNITEITSGKGHMYKGFFWKAGIHTAPLDLSTFTRKGKHVTIHSSLKKRLGLRINSSSPVPPFLDLSTKSRKGEIWKPAPRYEELYMVSNHGRVKALAKVTFGKQQRWMPEKIQRMTVDFQTDSKGHEVPGSMQVLMTKEGKKTMLSVARIVYHTFVRPFDLSDKKNRIYYKDHNPLNVKPSNLILRDSTYSITK